MYRGVQLKFGVQFDSKREWILARCCTLNVVSICEFSLMMGKVDQEIDTPLLLAVSQTKPHTYVHSPQTLVLEYHSHLSFSTTILVIKSLFDCLRCSRHAKDCWILKIN
jgi:hypothetical protein